LLRRVLNTNINYETNDRNVSAKKKLQTAIYCTYAAARLWLVFSQLTNMTKPRDHHGIVGQGQGKHRGVTNAHDT